MARAEILDGAHSSSVAHVQATPQSWRRRLRFVPGLLLSVAVAALASFLGRLVPVIGGPVFGIVIGMALATWASRRTELDAGVAFAGRRVLQAAIVVLGTELSLRQVAQTGFRSLPVMLGTLTLALVVAWLAGNLLRLRRNHQLLIGIGTAICGASAIAATTAVIEASEIDVAYSISTIFVFNVVAVLLYPAIGHLLGLSQHAFGLWAGTAINDVSSVVAASTTYGHAAATYAVVVKLTRTLMIIPIVVALAVSRVRSARRTDGLEQAVDLPWRRIVPWFIGWFLLAVVANSIGLIPSSWHGDLSQASTLLITVALSAVGLSARFAKMRHTGFRPLLLGAILWFTVGVGSLVLQRLTGQI